MSIDRRGFLAAILAAAVAPAYVRYGSLMVPVVRQVELAWKCDGPIGHDGVDAWEFIEHVRWTQDEIARAFRLNPRHLVVL